MTVALAAITSKTRGSPANFTEEHLAFFRENRYPDPWKVAGQRMAAAAKNFAQEFPGVIPPEILKDYSACVEMMQQAYFWANRQMASDDGKGAKGGDGSVRGKNPPCVRPCPQVKAQQMRHMR